MAKLNRKARLKDFRSSKPLYIFLKGGPYNKHNLRYNKFENPKEHQLIEFAMTKKVEIKNELVFGIEASPEDFTKYDFLNCWDGPGIIVHKRILKFLQEFCSEDFQVISMVIKNYDSEDKPFENRDYMLLNIVNELDVLDEEKSEYSVVNKFLEYPVFKPSSMQGHHLALVKGHVFYIISPELAYKLKDCTGIEFRVDWDSD